VTKTRERAQARETEQYLLEPKQGLGAAAFDSQQNTNRRKLAECTARADLSRAYRNTELPREINASSDNSHEQARQS
jgi:hypothetical protein